MGYYIDLKSISLSQLEQALIDADLVPSRMVLKNDIHEHFEGLRSIGIANSEELLNALKTKKKVADVAQQSDIDIQYLTILAREVKSYRKKPIKLADFPDTAAGLISALASNGIVNSLQFYDRMLTSSQRVEMAKELAVKESDLLRLVKLTDLTRIRWVNHTFAFVLYEAGYDSVPRVADADKSDLYDTIIRLNTQRNLYRGNIGLNDIKQCIESARSLSVDIEL